MVGIQKQSMSGGRLETWHSLVWQITSYCDERTYPMGFGILFCAMRNWN